MEQPPFGKDVTIYPPVFGVQGVVEGVIETNMTLKKFHSTQPVNDLKHKVEAKTNLKEMITDKDEFTFYGYQDKSKTLDKNPKNRQGGLSPKLNQGTRQLNNCSIYLLPCASFSFCLN